ncbi:RNA polymerase sigma factor [Allorhodopirellula solitaria]|uniref:RNA polymerase sigma factor n=1 Tax=Allorhodopirellula solitaria TaxID=2527987 RepID=A0A5C5YFZ0_9BACT|nr:sigma-70 family RNA polymerase sigma factor [Allorhodopirellula solitaria]TWT73988.1 RNA polymerase sigma factor [Allorhodopirellula solitaria]
MEQLIGDQADAWGVFERVYAGFIRANLSRSGIRDSDIDDVAQEVLVTVARGVKRFEFRPQAASFRSWLKSVARSRAMDHLRRQHRQQPEIELDAMAYIPSLECESDATGEHQTDLKELYARATLELSNYFRPESVKIFLALVQGGSVAQLASETGKSEAAIRQTKVRVLQRLREIAGE